MDNKTRGHAALWLVLSILFIALAGYIYSITNTGSSDAALSDTNIIDVQVSLEQTDVEVPESWPEPSQLNGQTPQLTWLVRPDHRLTGRLVDHLTELQGRYKSGDEAAGFILAVNLSTCDRVPDSKAELDARVDLWIEEELGQNFIDNLISRYDFCEGVDSDIRGQHLSLFTQLADTGYIPAMEVLGSIFDKAYMQLSKQSDLPRDEYVKQKRLFQHRKYHYLNQAARQGSMHALQNLAGLNAHKPQWTQKQRDEGYSSVSLALANSMALLHFTEDSVTFSRATFRQNKLLAVATDEEVVQAEQLAAELIQTIQQSGQAYTAIKENYR